MDILMPQLGETVAEGTVTAWHKQVGDAITPDEALFEVETDKVSTEIPSPIAGVLAEVLVPAGQTVKVGTRLAVVRVAGERIEPGAAAVLAPEPDALVEPAPALRALARGRGQKLSPVVRRLLAEHGLDPAAITGSGRDGRITREDVLGAVGTRRAAPEPAAVAQPPAAAVAPTMTEPVVAAAPSGSELVIGPDEVVLPLNSIRRKSAAALAQAWRSVPHVLQAVEADFSRIDALRRAHAEAWSARETFALTYLPFIALAVCRALARFEQLNARLDGDRLLISRRVRLGIAVDLNHEGLVVPVIRDAQDLTLTALAREIHRLARGARANRLRPDDFGQPTYTISNSGAFGTLITAPIVNPPQVAILSTDGVRKRAIVLEAAEGDSIAIRPIGVLAQSFDHRAIDGAYSAAFLRELKRILETRNWRDDLV